MVQTLGGSSIEVLPFAISASFHASDCAASLLPETYTWIDSHDRPDARASHSARTSRTFNVHRIGQLVTR
jgi:hypothetical protein